MVAHRDHGLAVVGQIGDERFAHRGELLGHACARSRMKKHPRFHIHFIPTGSSWLNLVERWFAGLTYKAVRRGSFQSVPDLIEKIMEFIESHNEHAKAFVWTATAEDILAKVERCRKRLEAISPGRTSGKKSKVA